MLGLDRFGLGGGLLRFFFAGKRDLFGFVRRGDGQVVLMKVLDRLVLRPLAGEDEDHDAGGKDRKADPLRGGERAVDAAHLVAAEVFDHKAPDGVQDQIPCRDGAAVLVVFEDHKQQHGKQHKEDRFHQRHGQAAHAVKVRDRERAVITEVSHQARFALGHAVAAADKQTADAPARVRKAEARHDQVGEREEIALLLIAEQQQPDDAADQTAVKHHALGDKAPKARPRRRGKEARQHLRCDDPVQQLHADKAAEHGPDDAVQHLVVPVEVGKAFGPIANQQRDDGADQNAEAHRRYAEAADLKQICSDHVNTFQAEKHRGFLRLISIYHKRIFL